MGAADEPSRIDMLVLHYTGDAERRSGARQALRSDGAGQCPLPRRGGWPNLAARARVAARISRRNIVLQQGRWPTLNLVSIGVEIVNPGHEWGYRPFPNEQMTAVETLCRDILSRHSIPPHRVVGSLRTSPPSARPTRSELFDWLRLARAGIGIWPEPAHAPMAEPVDRNRALADLAQIGYCRAAEPADGCRIPASLSP